MGLRRYALVLFDDYTVVKIPQNWRLPGWRICWVVGPKNLITALSQSGSFLDGGANHPYINVLESRPQASNGSSTECN